ncbi:MAG: hypothetical protein Q7S51_02045 [Gallionellaceae bacterium]|nr:hypothetical protein [Gallionellaceae bacterium]
MKMLNDSSMNRILTIAVQLFTKGDLFRSPFTVLKQWSKGFLLTLTLLVLIGHFVNPLVGIIVASLVGGAAQPWLFRDIKYQ